MADLKISELVSATSVAAVDCFVVVQSGETRKITPAVLFGNVPVKPVCKETPESISSGVISTAILTTKIDSPSAVDQMLTLALGTHGMEKEIVCHTLHALNTAIVTVSTGIGFSTITFNAVGQSVKLKNISGQWYVMGNFGATIV